MKGISVVSVVTSVMIEFPEPFLKPHWFSTVTEEVCGSLTLSKKNCLKKIAIN